MTSSDAVVHVPEIYDRASFANVFGGITAGIVEAHDLVSGGRTRLAPPIPELSWEEYRGQEMLKQQLLVRIHSAKASGERMPHVLLVAEGGFGKTTVSKLIAASLELPMIEITEPPKNNDEFIDRIWQLADGGGVLFADEVHLWPKGRPQHALMSLTEAQMIDSERGPVEFPGVTVVAATTDPQKLNKPLRSRFIRPTFQPYSEVDMAAMLDRMILKSGAMASAEDLAMLATASRGNPRQARHLAEAVRDLYRAGVPHDARTALAFCGIEPDGLTGEHMAYLRVLAGCRQGRAGKEALSDMLDMDSSEVRGLERLLSERGLVSLGGASGRQITPAGRRRVAS